MSLSNFLAPLFADHYVILLLDNEVTLEHFVINPPLPWIRLVREGEEYGVADGYPLTLTNAQARYEMRNWDKVSYPEMIRSLQNLGNAVDLVVFGNNAGQGLNLAEILPNPWRESKAAIIYGSDLLEQPQYEILGYRTFCPRSELLSYVLREVNGAGRPLALAFINTIQHDASSFHEPY